MSDVESRQTYFITINQNSFFIINLVDINYASLTKKYFPKLYLEVKSVEIIEFFECKYAGEGQEKVECEDESVVSKHHGHQLLLPDSSFK